MNSSWLAIPELLMSEASSLLEQLAGNKSDEEDDLDDD